LAARPFLFAALDFFFRPAVGDLRFFRAIERFSMIAGSILTIERTPRRRKPTGPDFNSGWIGDHPDC
jgi:hypothetical protein